MLIDSEETRDAVQKGYPFIPTVARDTGWDVPKCPYCGARHYHGSGDGLRLSHCPDSKKKSRYYLLPPGKLPRKARPVIYFSTPMHLETWEILALLARATNLTMPQAAFLLMRIGVNTLLEAIQRAKAQATTEK